MWTQRKIILLILSLSTGLLTIMVFFCDAGVSSAQTSLIIPATAEGTTYTANSAGIYRFKITAGAVQVCPPVAAPDHPEWWGWKTEILIYKNRPIVWSGGAHAPEHPNPADWDFSVGSKALQPTYGQAEQIGMGMYVDIPLQANEYIILVVNDSRGYFWDNSGGITLASSILIPVLLVHGCWSSGDVWINSGVTQLLMDHDFSPSLIDFCPNNDSIINEGIKVAERMATLRAISPDVPIDIVAHSMGGLAVRWYLTNPQLWPTDENGQPRHGVRKFITLGTPHLGTDMHLLHPILANKLEFDAQNRNGDCSYYLHDPPYNFMVWSPGVQEMTAVWKPPSKWRQKGKGFVEPMGEIERGIPLACISLGQEWLELLNLFPLDDSAKCLTDHINYYFEMKNQIMGQSNSSPLLSYLKKSKHPQDIDYYLVYGTNPTFIPFLIAGDYGDGLVHPDSATAKGIKLKKKAVIPPEGVDSNHGELPDKAKGIVLQCLLAPPLK